METIHWYNYLAALFAGAFLTNAVPHFLNGISGNRFPTPFAKPMGRGLSSPLTNTLWAIFNLVIGYFLFLAGKITSNNKYLLLVFFTGILLISIRLSMNFAKKVKE